MLAGQLIFLLKVSKGETKINECDMRVGKQLLVVFLTVEQWDWLYEGFMYVQNHTFDFGVNSF